MERDKQWFIEQLEAIGFRHDVHDVYRRLGDAVEVNDFRTIPGYYESTIKRLCGDAPIIDITESIHEIITGVSRTPEQKFNDIMRIMQRNYCLNVTQGYKLGLEHGNQTTEG